MPAAHRQTGGSLPGSGWLGAPTGALARAIGAGRGRACWQQAAGLRAVPGCGGAGRGAAGKVRLPSACGQRASRRVWNWHVSNAFVPCFASLSHGEGLMPNSSTVPAWNFRMQPHNKPELLIIKLKHLICFKGTFYYLLCCYIFFFHWVLLRFSTLS